MRMLHGRARRLSAEETLKGRPALCVVSLCVVVCGMLHVACRMLHAACCMLHAACCMPHVACRMLHVACCMPRCQLSAEEILKGFAGAKSNRSGVVACWVRAHTRPLVNVHRAAR